MKSEIFIFFVLGFCFNIVAPYHKYAGFQQEAYQPQKYPSNPSPVYQAHHPAVINYEPPQQVVNYVRGPSETKYVMEPDTSLQDRKPEEELQEVIQQKVIEKQSDAIFEERAQSQMYPERPSLYIAPVIPERNYNTHGQVYSDLYATQGPRHWRPRNAYRPSLSVQEPYIETAVVTYPQWQSRAHKAIPRQNEYYGDSYSRQNAFNKPMQYISQPRHAKLAEILPGPETKTQSIQPQYEHNGSSFDRHNTYKTPVQYIARPEQVKAEEVLKKEVVKQKNEFHQNPSEHNMPVRYASHLHQAKHIEAPSVSETKIQPTVFRQQETEYYGSPYKRKYIQNVPVQYKDEQQAKPVQETSVSETKIQPAQPERENYENPHQRKPARDVLVQYVAESQQAKPKPVEVSSASEMKIQPVQHDEYYERPSKQKYIQNVPVQYEEKPQQAKPLEVSSVLETKIQQVKRDEYNERPNEQENVRDVLVQYVAEPQQATPVDVSSDTDMKIQPVQQDESPYEEINVRDIIVRYGAEPQQAMPVEALSGSDITIQPVQDQIYYDSLDEKPNTSNIPEQFTAQPQKAPVVQRPLGSETITLEKLANRPEVIDFLASKSQKRRYLIFHQNGTVEHVDSIDDSLLGNSLYFKSNDLRPETAKHKETPLENIIGPTISIPHIENTSRNPKLNNNHFVLHRQPISKEIKPALLPTTEDSTKTDYVPNQINYKNNTNTGTILPKHVVHNNYHPISVIKKDVTESYKNRPKHNPSPRSEKDKNYYYYPDHKNSNNPSRIQNNLYDDNKHLLEDVVTPVAYNAKDAFNRYVEPATTALPIEPKNIQNKSDIMNTYPEIEPFKTSNILDSFAQKAPQETNKDTSSNVQIHPGKANPSTDELKNVTTEAYVVTPKNNTNNEHTDVTDADYSNDRSLKETTPSTTDILTNIESDNDNLNDRFSIEANTEYINNTEVTAEDETQLSPAEDTITLFPAEDKTTLSRVEPLDTETETDAEKKEQQMEDVILIEQLTTENKLGENEVVVDKDFWDAVYSANDTGGFNELFIFNVKVDEPVIEKNSRSYVLANGTHVEETEEIIWEHKSDAVPRETKYTRITKNYDPEVSASTKSKPTKDSKTPICNHHKS